MKKIEFLPYQFLIDEFFEKHIKYAKTKLVPATNTMYYTGKWENIVLQFTIVLSSAGHAVVMSAHTLQMQQIDLLQTNPDQYARAEKLRNNFRTALNNI